MNSTASQWSNIFDIFGRHVHYVLPALLRMCTWYSGFPWLFFFSVMKASVPGRMYVVTTDQEKAIKTGLSKSKLNDSSMQFFCGLHAKWSTYFYLVVIGIMYVGCIRWCYFDLADVSSHKIGKKKTFGKDASNEWQKHMCWAEGPRAFRTGFNKMCALYCKDPARLKYIHELSRDKNKHNYTKDLRFSNAVLTDVTETLVRAAKHWIYGTGTQSPSLLMAVVRVTDGCHNMANKPLLHPRAKTRSLVSHKSPQVQWVFERYVVSVTLPCHLYPCHFVL